MKCTNCGSSAMTTKKENVPYAALPGTVLVGVDVSRCGTCGEHEVAIPAIDELNRQLALAVIEKPTRLAGPEIRFLRTSLGYSAVDFAKLIGSNASTISRWESDAQPMGHHADLLLRALVVIDKRIDDYSIAAFGEVSDEPSKKTKSPPYALTPTAPKKWIRTKLAA